jgi:bifunctional non-homologous end joining protein LigD
VHIELPKLIEPLHPRLAKAPIEDERYSCELKWDGVRAQIHVEGGRYRVLTRSRRDVAGNYPEFFFLSSLPTGTVIDAEIVVMDGERPSFHRVMVRDRATRLASARR